MEDALTPNFIGETSGGKRKVLGTGRSLIPSVLGDKQVDHRVMKEVGRSLGL